MDFESRMTAPRAEAEERIHGSLERLPGGYFRALAALFLREHPDWSRGALARELGRRLESGGIRFHERTLKRQLAGTIDTVPPELESSLEALLGVGSGQRTPEQLRAELRVVVPGWNPADHAPEYLAVRRILPLAQLWLHGNPGSSKRSLACRLYEMLAGRGISVNVDSLQGALAGKKRLVQPQVREALLECLRAQGIGSEAEARARWAELETEVRRSIEARDFVDAGRFRRLCLLWRMHRREASSRALALRVQEALRAGGRRVGLHHLQNLVNGRTRRVRAGILAVLEQMIGRECPEALSGGPAEAPTEADLRRAADLGWVRADPIVTMARQFLAAHPDFSLRRLALTLARTIRRMGYETSPNTLQPILGGWKRKTRGYVYRAMQKHLGVRPRARIPVDLLISPLPTVGGGLTAPGPEDPQEVAVARLAIDLRSHRSRNKPTAEQFLRAAHRHLKRARSVNFLEFQAWRASKWYGISRAEARERIVHGLRGRRIADPESLPDEALWPADADWDTLD